ncbi:MAG: type II secretion system F family protein [Proteobacteria bacterium]|nr:type II secretion system F family protein [Pseudomonadota bacterium]
MPKFQYRAVDGSGRLLKGTSVAANVSEMEKQLRGAGLTLIDSRKIVEGIGAGAGKWLSGKIKPRIIIEFYYRLSQTLELGLPILSALEENEKIIPSKAMRRIVGEMKISIEAGNMMNEAMSRFPKVFQKLEMGIIRMGEQSGGLPKSLKSLAEFMEWREDIRSTIRRATIYPSFIILSIGAVIGMWVGYVLPRMAGLLKEMGVPLPPVTRAVLGVSLFFQGYWLYILTGIGLMVVLFLMFRKTKNGAVFLQKYMLKIPVIGPVATNIAMARLSQNFATMYAAGVTLHNIFEILADNVLGNRYLEGRLEEAYREIQRGQSIAAGLEAVGGFPPLLLGAVRNGETTGTLDVSFARLGTYYNNEVKRSVQTMVNMIEPLSILFLGGVFGLIALSILLPLYDVMSQFK